MADNYDNFQTGLDSPAVNAEALTASDDEIDVTRALHVNASGTITVQFVNSDSDVALVVVQGQTYPYRIKKLKTVASGAVVIGLY